MQPAVAHQQHDGGSRELLGKRGQAKICFRIDGTQGAQIGNAVSTAEDRLSVADDKDGGAGSVAGFQRGEDDIDLGGGNLG